MSAEGSVEHVMSGEDALVATAELLLQQLRSDSRLEQSFATVDLAKLASSVHHLLSGVFYGDDWPQFQVPARKTVFKGNRHDMCHVSQAPHPLLHMT